MTEAPDQFLKSIFAAALGAVQASRQVPPFLPRPPLGKTIVVGAGKAAAAMAKAVEDNFTGDIETGLVVTRDHHGLPLKIIEVVEAGHPRPDQRGRKAARRILELAKSLTPDDLMLCLFSGGGSALLTLPALGVEAVDIETLNDALLRSGANIVEFNCVRKHLSQIAGGRLARAAYRARVISLIISDVSGDDISVIASGPTVGDPTTFFDAREILQRYHVTVPLSIARHLEEAKEETIKPDDPCFKNVENKIIAVSQDALEAAAEVARAQGITPLILGSAIEGEAKDVASVMAGIAKQVIRYGQPVTAPCVLISGGETTVTVRGTGKGGRNSEFLLYLALALDGAKGVHAISCGTDGTDGTEENAGAIIHPDILRVALSCGLDARQFAAANDSYSFFERCGGLIETGPTRTNVNDFRAIFIAEGSQSAKDVSNGLR